MEHELSRQHVEKLLSASLKASPLCVIATSSDNIPRASTVEFFPIGTTLYILTEGGKKIENIKHNPHVSVAIHAEFTGWSDVKGLQITGFAEIGQKGSRIFNEGIRAYERRRGRQSTALSLPDFMNVIKVKPAKRGVESGRDGGRQRGFNEAAWLSAPLPLWYGDAQPSPGTRLTDMQGGYTCVFLRQRFILSTVNDIATLELGAQSDDGFIAWINGV